MAKVVKDTIVQPILEYISPKLSSQVWSDREKALMALGGIMEELQSDVIYQSIAESYPNFLEFLDDPAPKVRKAASWMCFRMVENCSNLVFNSPETLDLFINKLVSHISDHHIVATKAALSLKILYVKAAQLKVTDALCPYFA